MHRPAASPVLRIAAALLAGLFAAGCGDDGLAVDDDRDGGGGHGSFDELEVFEATTNTLLATWTRDTAWLDANGDSLDALPPAVVGEGGVLEPLRAGGPPASLFVGMRGEQTDLDIAAIDTSAAAAPTCGEFSVRYFPRNDATTVIAWPNVAHPDEPGGPAQYALRTDGELVPIYYCDTLDIFPEQTGVANLEMLLWHVNHADQASDPLPVEVQ